MNFRVIGKLTSDGLLKCICFFIPAGTYKTNQITHDLSLHSLLLNCYSIEKTFPALQYSFKQLFKIFLGHYRKD